MISDDESACIADIGLNALLRKVIHEDRVTIPQSWMYKAPEEILPGDDEFEPTMAMDVYALAGTIYTVRIMSLFLFPFTPCMIWIGYIRHIHRGPLTLASNMPRG